MLKSSSHRIKKYHFFCILNAWNWLFSERNLGNWSWWAVSCHTHVHSFNSSISLTSRKQKWLEEDIGQSAIWWYFLCLHIKVMRVGSITFWYLSLCQVRIAMKVLQADSIILGIPENCGELSRNLVSRQLFFIAKMFKTCQIW